MILLIDNYDSFTYNLVQRLGELDAALDVRVYRNDQITRDEVERLKPSHIIISPGPSTTTASPAHRSHKPCRSDGRSLPSATPRAL